MKFPCQFEIVVDGLHQVLRLKVPGGWLVIIGYSVNSGKEFSYFISDPNHSWELEK